MDSRRHGRTMAAAIPRGNDRASCSATNEQAEQARADAYTAV